MGIGSRRARVGGERGSTLPCPLFSCQKRCLKRHFTPFSTQKSAALCAITRHNAVICTNSHAANRRPFLCNRVRSNRVYLIMLNPLPAAKWNEATAAHLWNRAGFGGTPEEIARIAGLSHDAAISWFLDYERIPDDVAPPDWARPDPERQQKLRNIQQMTKAEKDPATPDDEKQKLAQKRREMFQEYQRENVRQLEEMRIAWLRRMAHGPRPLQEKLTLFWHGHFATSAVKVRESYFIWRQIDLFRRMAAGNWLALLEAVATDPAMLVWLDQAQSRKEHPNENFAREVMELFTLGEGHYTEKDVTEAARAMTGWSLDRMNEEYRYRPFLHDNGAKTFLGRAGNLNGRDVLETVVAQPQAALFITAKLWKFFASDDPRPEVIAALAQVFRDSGNEFKPLLRAMFRCQEFYDDSVVRSQVKSPVQWLVGSIRLLERTMPPPLVCTEMTRNLGQDLLAPPNVKGWDGGVSWITTNTLLGRYNDAAILVMGQGNLGSTGDRPGLKFIADRANEMARNLEPADVAKFISQEDRADKPRLIASLERRFLQGALSPKQRDALRDYLNRHDYLTDNDLRHAIRLLMATPDYQLI